MGMKTNWEQFDPYSYVDNNYSSIHDEDREIIRKLVEFYSSFSPLNQGKIKIAYYNISFKK